MKIWCVEDDDGIRDIELYAFANTGFDSKGFIDGESLWEGLKIERPDLIILDVMLPGEDGVEILKKLRNHPVYHSIPVIMATAKGMEYDKIQSLDLGADDYLVKPFGMLEMVSRVKAVLRRTNGNLKQRVLQMAELILDIDKHTVMVKGKKTNLTFKEFEILRLFLSSPGTVYSREQLFEEIWGSEFVGESRTVDMHIRTLRQKLGPCGDYIKTVRGVGYKMEVQE